MYILSWIYISAKNDHLIFGCFEQEKIYKEEFNKDLIKRLENEYEFCGRDIVKFILLLRKGVWIHAYEYMDSWERFDETSLPDK